MKKKKKAQNYNRTSTEEKKVTTSLDDESKADADTVSAEEKETSLPTEEKNTEVNEGKDSKEAISEETSENASEETAEKETSEETLEDDLKKEEDKLNTSSKENHSKKNSSKKNNSKKATNQKDSVKTIVKKEEEKEKESSELKETSENIDSDKKTEEDAEFVDFFKEVWKNVYDWITKNRRIALMALLICASAILVIIIVSVITKKRDSMLVDATASMNGTASESMNGTLSVPQDPLQMDAYPEVNALIQQYFDAMQNNDLNTFNSLCNYVDTVEAAKIAAKCEFVESYQNIVCYTKAGPFENSYIVYVVYDVKFYNWDQTAPSEITKLVCTREDGSLYIYSSGDFDANVADYIVAISSQADVVDLINRVKTEYSEILDSDPEFKTYMEALSQTIKDEVGELLAAETVSESDVVSGDSVSDNTQTPDDTVVSDNEVAQAEGGSFDVKTTTTVNVRMSDSEEADKLGKVVGGTILTCNEQLDNGWSQVVYEGQVGYIKTEYLERVDGDGDENHAIAAGNVTVSETVNIRETPDTNGEKVGVAYAGESFALVEDMGNGWTKILYNGEEAYIKSEYLED